MSNTIPASSLKIADSSMWLDLEIVNVLRLYEFFSMTESETNALTITTPSSQDEDEILLELLNKFRQDECYSDAHFTSTHEGRLWRSLREVNQNKRLEFFSKTSRRFTSTKDLTRSEFFSEIIRDSTKAPSSQDTLIHMLNMLSWYKFDSTSPTIAVSKSRKEDNKWDLITEVEELYNKALGKSFYEFNEECNMIWCKIDGSFQCDNVLSIWPKIRKSKSSNNKNYPDIKEPKDVGEKIKEGLKPEFHMIEGEPSVHGVGFVTIKLSRNFMAKNIHKMLREGIDTWAPRQQLETKSTIVYSPSWDESNLMPMDLLRRQFIIMSRMHMLEYVKSAAITFSGNGMSLPPGELHHYFVPFEKGGGVRIYPTDDTKALIHGKIRTQERERERDGNLGYPLEDLGALRHGLLDEKADLIMCVTPTQQQDYIEECFNAAEHAGWAKWTNDNFWPLKYVGFKTCSTSLEDLLSFLYKAQYPCEAGDAAKVLGYTHEAVLDCALTYTFLKYNRLVDCKFGYNEMLDIKGDTFVHLLTTQAQIRKITNHFLKEIDELKKASNLGEDEVNLSQGVEYALGLHLLMFTQLIDETYVSFFPHLLCRYLYDLSEKFSHFYETYVSSGFEVKTRLLLCEATAIVMEKGFHLLGITQKPSLQAVSAALVLNYVAPLEVRSPLKNPNIRTRFEVFTTYLYITRDYDFEDGELFGSIQVSDYYGLMPEGYLGTFIDPGPCYVSLVNQDPRHSVKMKNNGRLEIGNPISRHSVPFSSWMEIRVMLYATTNSKDDLFEVCNIDNDMCFSSFLRSGLESSCEYLVAKGDDGHMQMHYILLRDALDATIKVHLDGVSGRNVCGKILAYYDKLNYGDDNLVEGLYKAALFESFDDSNFLKNGDVPLTRSILAVPNTGSLVIEAHLTDFDSGDDILCKSCVFSSLSTGSFTKDIKSDYFTLVVEITCSQD